MINAKRAIVLCNGELNIDHFELRPDDIIICADGGAIHAARLGWQPHVIIGDLDSISDAVRVRMDKAGVSFQIYPSEKDKTDGELALDYAVQVGAEEVIVLGALGGRIDHVLTNVFLLAKYFPRRETARRFPRIRILNNQQAMWLVGDHTMIHGKIGDTVSLIPLSERVTGVSTTGLYYPLNDGTLEFGSSLGNSNKMVSDVATVSIADGKLLVVHMWNE